MPEVAPADDKKISLALKPILQSLPVFELSGDPKEVPEEARVEFSFSLIHSQLATGRVAVPPELFEKALPPDGRRFFTAKNLQMPVLLPLQEILKSMPADALRMRDDQEEREVGETIETPFPHGGGRFEALQQRPHRSCSRIRFLTSPLTPRSLPKNQARCQSIVAPSALCPFGGCALTFTDGFDLAGNLPPELTPMRSARCAFNSAAAEHT